MVPTKRQIILVKRLFQDARILVLTPQRLVLVLDLGILHQSVMRVAILSRRQKTRESVLKKNNAFFYNKDKEAFIVFGVNKPLAFWASSDWYMLAIHVSATT